MEGVSTPFPPPGKVLQYVSGRRLGGPEGLSGCGGKDKSLFTGSHVSSLYSNYLCRHTAASVV